MVSDKSAGAAGARIQSSRGLGHWMTKARAVVRFCAAPLSGRLDRLIDVALYTLIAGLCVVRFVGLETSPPGFFGDESFAAIHMACLAETGRSAYDQPWPLFARGLGGGLYTPVYLYTGLAWTRIFGLSIASMRAMVAFYTVLAIGGVTLLARQVMDSRAAKLVALAAALSPWSFQFSRIAGDAPLAPAFLVWSCYVFLRWPGLAGAATSGALMSLAAYAYVPTRVQVALIVLLLLFLERRRLSLSRVAAFLGVMVLCSVPLLIAIVRDAALLERSQDLVIFGSDYVKDHRGALAPWIFVIKQFFENMHAYLSPSFLFFTGDPNLRHSTQVIGELGYVDDLALAVAVLAMAWILRRVFRGEAVSLGTKERRAVEIALLAVLAGGFGVIPAALTWEGQPHMLRALGTWPAVALFTGACLWTQWRRWRVLPVLVLGLAVVQITYLGGYYFWSYPKVAFDAFNGEVRRAAESGDVSQFARAFKDRPDLEAAYHWMRTRGDSCRASLDAVQRLNSSLH